MTEADCLSLPSGYGYKEWYVHRAHGVRTRADVAKLDRRTAGLRDDYSSVGDLNDPVDAARSVSPGTGVEEIVGSRSSKKIEIPPQPRRRDRRRPARARPRGRRYGQTPHRGSWQM